MFLITCPYCGTRDQSEFAYAGEAHIARPEWRDDMTDAEWAEFVFMRTNTKGVFAERWMHAAGCRKIFNVLRNTATDEILAVYKVGETPPDVEAVLLATPSGEVLGSGNDAVKIIGSNGEGGA
ncbi:MAG: sarcosine oxidase subunit delta [Pseudomonadota bacterium]